MIMQHKLFRSKQWLSRLPAMVPSIQTMDVKASVKRKLHFSPQPSVSIWNRPSCSMKLFVGTLISDLFSGLAGRGVVLCTLNGDLFSGLVGRGVVLCTLTGDLFSGLAGRGVVLCTLTSDPFLGLVVVLCTLTGNLFLGLFFVYSFLHDIVTTCLILLIHDFCFSRVKENLKALIQLRRKWKQYRKKKKALIKERKLISSATKCNLDTDSGYTTSPNAQHPPMSSVSTPQCAVCSQAKSVLSASSDSVPENTDWPWVVLDEEANKIITNTVHERSWTCTEIFYSRWPRTSHCL